MKIKTITCHNVYNHGASLQEYALIRYLTSLGHETEAIDYTPPYLSNQFKLWVVNNSFFNKNLILRFIYIVLKLPTRLFNLKRKKAFDRFSKQFIPHTKTNYQSCKELARNIPDAEAFICGSDQIWNSFFENGKDPAFYLDFAPEDKLKISYAASFAIDRLDEEIKGFVKEKVNRLNYISVRESSGVKILNDLDIPNVAQVLDPVFLLTSSQWIELSEKVQHKKDYIFIYDFDANDQIKKLALQIKERYNFQIVTVNQRISYADETFYYKGPNTFLSLIRNANFIISNSFHAVAFSIIFEKQFLVFNRFDKINTRMRDLLKMIDLSHFLISDYSDVDLNLLSNIDYSVVNPKLDDLIVKSQTFLHSSLLNQIE